jgi:hypothetical protein
MYAVIETAHQDGEQIYSEQNEEYATEAEANAAAARNFANYAANQGDDGITVRWHVEAI